MFGIRTDLWMSRKHLLDGSICFANVLLACLGGIKCPMIVPFSSSSQAAATSNGQACLLGIFRASCLNMDCLGVVVAFALGSFVFVGVGCFLEHGCVFLCWVVSLLGGVWCVGVTVLWCVCVACEPTYLSCI